VEKTKNVTHQLFLQASPATTGRPDGAGIELLDAS
jgi:hypothetical protein